MKFNYCPSTLQRMGRRKALVMWGGVALAVLIRLVLFAIGAPLKLGRSIEVATPVTSLVRLAEGFWLKQLGMSPYAGGSYHGSPLLLETLGPIVTKSSIAFLLADVVAAFLLFLTGKVLLAAREQYTSELELPKLSSSGEGEDLDIGELAALLYLLNPFTVVACVGGCTSPIENCIIFLALYAAVAGNAPLAAFGWVTASHVSMYPAILSIPVALALSCGPDKPPSKYFNIKSTLCKEKLESSSNVRWSRVWDFLVWSAVWSSSILGLCSYMLEHHGGLREMIVETYGFILTVKDLSPNIGIYWYFFTEVFDFFRSFFLMVFQGNIFCMVAPLTIRLHHRPLFLAFVLIAIVSTLKSYPSVGDAALYLGMMGLFVHELSEFRYSFLLLNGYICIAILGPVMYNLWIWRGTGNANFYFATALAYAFVQTILIVESVGSILRFERSLKTTLKSSLEPKKPQLSAGVRERCC